MLYKVIPLMPTELRLSPCPHGLFLHKWILDFQFIFIITYYLLQHEFQTVIPLHNGFMVHSVQVERAIDMLSIAFFAPFMSQFLIYCTDLSRPHYVVLLHTL